jgi:predicted secreted Zn-dependent protease
MLYASRLVHRLYHVDAKKLLKKNYYYFSLDTNTVEEVMKLKLEQFSLDYE